MMLQGVPKPDLSGADFQGWKVLEGMGLHNINDLKLDGANLGRAKLSGLWLGGFQNLTLGQVVLTNCHLGAWSDCSAKEARFERCAVYACEFHSCDFTSSELDLQGDSLKLVGCVYFRMPI